MKNDFPNEFALPSGNSSPTTCGDTAVLFILALVRPLMLVGLLLMPLFARASVVVATNASPSETAFDLLISTADLVNSGQASFSALTNTIAPNSAFTLHGMHDGAAASYAFDPTGAFAKNTYYSATQTTVTFLLNLDITTGGSAGGYDLTGINVFSGWQDADIFQGQKWTLRVATVSHPDFIDIQSVGYSPPAGSRSSMVSVTNNVSPIAFGVTAVQFDLQQLSSAGVVVREIDIFGLPARPTTPPPAPVGLTALGSTGLSNAQVTLFWTPTPGARGYQIRRAQANEIGYQLVGSSIIPAFTDTTVTNGQTYHYVITATNIVGDSPYSSQSTATTLAQPAAPLRILCIGDGTTTGYTDNPYWAIPFEFGFRSGLYLRMLTNGHPVQFVGGSPEPWNGSFGLPTNSPSPDLRALGQDYHRGYAGANTSFVLQNLSYWLYVDDPDIILMLVGLDDLDTTVARSNLTNIVQTIATIKPNAFTIFAQVTPTIEYSQFIVDYNRFVRETLVPSFQAQGNRVSTVDQYAHLLSSGAIDPFLFSNWYNHPDNPTYDRMAQTWYVGIQAALASEVQVTFTKMTMSGSTVTLAGSGGPPNARFELLTSTDPTLPVANWQTSSPMGTFDSAGNFTCTSVFARDLPTRFFRIKLQ